MRELTHEQQNALNGFTFIDLFAGMGGFHLACESHGAELVFASEWDRHAQDTYEQNFGVRPHGDITQINEEDVPDHDILCGGFPCQAFSVSGKRAGFSDARGTLFFDVARIVKAKRPRVVFLENVKNLAAHDSGNTLRVIENTLQDDLGYTLFHRVIDPTKHNVPQKRERIYLVAFRDPDDAARFQWIEEKPLLTHVQDLLQPANEVPASLYVNRSDLVVYKSEPATPVDRPYQVGRVAQGRQGERVYSTRGASITFSAYGGGAFAKTGGYLIDGIPRRLTPREAARVMGYPESYELHPTQAYKQLGNSVVVPVLQDIVGAIATAVGN